MLCPACGGAPPFCDACIEQRLSWLGGTAALRGWHWAGAVAATVGTAKQWPPFEGRCAAIARRKVEDVTRGDDGLADRLARLCLDAAAARWVKMNDAAARDG